MWRKRWVKIVLVLVAVLLGGFGWVIYSVKQVRPFYTAALATPEQRLIEGNKEFLNRTSRFYNDIRKLGEWSIVLTEDQINGWLAIDLPKNHPDALPPEIRDPRVKIENGVISIGVMVDREPFPVVASLDVRPKFRGTRAIALQFLGLRIGALPWSLENVMASVRSFAQEKDRGWDIHEEVWGSDPVALVRLLTDKTGKGQMSFEALEVRDGEIMLRGRTSVE
jgi:hypothetical protein